MNVGLSVSRVGSAAQTKATKKVAGRIKGNLLNIAKWRRSPSSAPISTPSPSACSIAARDSTELLKQPQFSLKMEEQVYIIYAKVNGYIDKLPLDKVRPFEDGLLASPAKNPDILEAIRSSSN